MRKAVVLLLLLPGLGAAGRAAEPGPGNPFERRVVPPSRNPVDVAVRALLREKGIEPAFRCSDAVFLRRVYLDVTGTLPEPRAVLRFLADRRPGKRARVIDELLERKEYADYWALRWCDLLRVKSEFPVKLWPNAVQAYHRFVRDALRENRPLDEFARELLTASGSNFRVPAVNFYRAVSSRDPASLAQAVALTFLGVRVKSWPEARRKGMEAFFSRVAYKKTAEWKEEIVFPDPAPRGEITAVFPDGTAVRIPPDEDPRKVFADWLLRPGNPWFARSVANRVWAWLMGRGIIHEPDDIRPENPPSNPALLACLTREFTASRFDLKHLIRLILESETYQQSPIPRSDDPRAEALFAHAIVRRLDAEVLIDALCWITGTTVKYQSPIPEPFTFIPEDHRTIELADGSITSPLLEMFGRPSRDTGLWSERNNRVTGSQRLFLLNSSDIQGRIERGFRLRAVLRNAGRNPRRAIRAIYLHILSRPPTEEETALALDYARRGRANPKQAADDLVWALINTKEFLYRH